MFNLCVYSIIFSDPLKHMKHLNLTQMDVTITISDIIINITINAMITISSVVIIAFINSVPCW